MKLSGNGNAKAFFKAHGVKELDDAASGADASIRHDRHSEQAAHLSTGVDGRASRAAGSTHVLSGANASRAHAHAHSVSTALDQVKRLLGSDDISRHDLICFTQNAISSLPCIVYSSPDITTVATIQGAD